MSYQINTTNGSLLTTVPDATLVQNYAGLLLIGKSYAGFGTALNDNLVYLAENFCNSTPPTNPLTGQLWYDSVNKVITVYNGTTFGILSINTPAASPPSSPGLGDEWFDTINQQLNVFNGSNWVLVGPTSQAGSGLNGIVTSSLTQNNSIYYFADVYASNQLLALISSNNLITSSINGFGNLRVGVNFVLPSTNIANVLSGGIYNAANVTLGSEDQLALSINPINDGLITSTSNLSINPAGGTIYPAANSVVSLGSATNVFKNLYVSNILGANISATPNGANLQMQYKNGSAFAGANVYVNPANISIQSNLQVTGNISTGNITANSITLAGTVVGNAFITNTLVSNIISTGTLLVANTATTSVANVGSALLSNGVNYVPYAMVQNVLAGAVIGSYYQNQTLVPINVSVYCAYSTGTVGIGNVFVSAYVGPVATNLTTPVAANGLNTGAGSVNFVVLPGYWYKVTIGGPGYSGPMPTTTQWTSWTWQ